MDWSFCCCLRLNLLKRQTSLPLNAVWLDGRESGNAASCVQRLGVTSPCTLVCKCVRSRSSISGASLTPGTLNIDDTATLQTAHSLRNVNFHHNYYYYYYYNYCKSLNCKLNCKSPGFYWYNQVRPLVCFSSLVTMLISFKQECSKSTDLRSRNPLFSHPTDLYPNRATKPKCKLMLAKSLQSAHKNWN